MKKTIAVDLGASNGRIIVGTLEGIEVVHRFETYNFHAADGSFRWDLEGIIGEIRKGMTVAFGKYGDEIASVGIDTWGVDYVLLGSDDMPVSPVFHYRDARTDGLIEEVSDFLGGKEYLFSRTGIAFQPFNTIYQLYAHKRDRTSEFAEAVTYLSLPDYIAFRMCGVKANERSHASTTQLYNPLLRSWDDEILHKLGIPRSLFLPIVDSGTVLGELTEQFRKQVGAPAGVKVIAVGNHDTASAVAAVPVTGTDKYLYVSSGTWSLLGVENDEPILTKVAMDAGFTNEVAASGRIRFLENIMGMWIQQECVRNWEAEEGVRTSWKALDEQTIEVKNFNGCIDPMDPRYLKASSPDSLMKDRVAADCREHGMDVPVTKGEYMVAIYRGLAKAYKAAIEDLERIVSHKYPALYIIGGGSKNEILDKWTAEETGMTVFAGPVEATAIGNIIMQEFALGEIASVDEGRAIVKKAFEVKEFRP